MLQALNFLNPPRPMPLSHTISGSSIKEKKRKKKQVVVFPEFVTGGGVPRQRQWKQLPRRRDSGLSGRV